ncbi:hypothetical protein AMTRI_Chr03g44740 [Amborella trichopoda]
MEVRSPVEDEFSKLHPCLPLSTRICIVGAGPSGLSAAYALANIGYEDITVYEKYHTVGGMCESVDIEGRIYDLGGQVLAMNSAPVLSNLAKEFGCEFEEMDSHKLALIDDTTGHYEDLKVAEDYVSIISLTLKLQDEAKASGKLGVHAVSNLAPDPILDFLSLHGLHSVPKSVAYGYTASGYGFTQDMPYAYLHEFTRTSMAGKIRRFNGGYMSLWQKLSTSLPYRVLCNSEVVGIERLDDKVRVRVLFRGDEEELEKMMEFDKIIVSGAFPFRYGRTYRAPVPATSTVMEPEVMDLNDLERELFCKVHTIDYYTTVLKIKGFEHIPAGFYYFGKFMEHPATIGNPVAMQKFYGDTDIFLFWSYGNSTNVKGESVLKLSIDVVKSMGGEVQRVVLQRRFKYFPHVTSEEMKDGFYDKWESELQGSRNTYYVCGLGAFELTERNASYAMALVRRHFASDGPFPPFPYVKRMLPLHSGHRSQKVKELPESPGVEFPELQSLDEYLEFWGTHIISETKTLYTWINEEGEVTSERTYGDLHKNASIIAHKLTSTKPVIKPGDRVLLIHVPGLDFVDAFFGCLRAKVLPVPLLPPDPLQRGGQALPKIENVAKSCEAVAILSTASYHAAVRAGSVRNLLVSGKNKSSARWPQLPWLHTDSWLKNSRNSGLEEIECSYCTPKPDDLCFLQFTSGSTGDSKGVMITHGGLIHNVKLMRKRYKSTSKTVLVSWLPQYHDMGLIGGLFTALVSGGSSILFSPLTFLRNPLLWIHCMSKYRATHSAGPNFAFELVVRRLEAEKVRDRRSLDLSSLIFLMVAAEPVRQKTIKRFIELTSPLGLSEEVMAPGYGLAENCVFVSCAWGEKVPIYIDWQGRVCCGNIKPEDPDVDIRIVDQETGGELHGDGKEGEIWVSSPSAGIGYWGKHELSLKTFGNELDGHPGKSFTRTGDLGRIISGKLFITGRIKDLIIVSGRNVYSADVEKTVEASSELIRPGCCAVIGVPEEVLSTKGIKVPDGADQVGLVVIAEVREGKPVSKELVKQIQTRVAEEHGVTVASVKLIKPRTISKTTSGKIKRFECLKQFTDESLSLVADSKPPKKFLFQSFTTGANFNLPPMRQEQSFLEPLKPRKESQKSRREITEFLIGLVAEQASIPLEKISETDSLVSYGIDSIGVVRAAQKLSDFLGVPVGAIDIFTAKCISDLASFSESLISEANTASCLVNLPEYDDKPVFLAVEVSNVHRLGIGFLQFLVLIYVAAILVLPAYLSCSISMEILNRWVSSSSWVYYPVSAMASPLIWLLYMFLTCICISLFGNSFLRPNVALNQEISIWSKEFVGWWAMYKLQEMAGKIMATHLRGTIFLNYWFKVLGAIVGSEVVLDSVDITDPFMVSIGDGAVVAEGAMIQGHEVKGGMVRFGAVRIGQGATIGPYAMIRMGCNVNSGFDVPALQRAEGGAMVVPGKKDQDLTEGFIGTPPTKVSTLFHFMGIYTVGFLGALSAATAYTLLTLFNPNHIDISPQIFLFVCIAGAFHWPPAIIAAFFAFIPSQALPALSSTSFALLLSSAYIAYALILSLVTCLATHLLTRNPEYKLCCWKSWLLHRITTSTHLRFAKLLSGTEAFCVYLRSLGASIGQDCSIRAINPISDPRLLKLCDFVHLGDFCKILTGFYSKLGYCFGNVEVNERCVIGSMSLVLPGSCLQEEVVLGALSTAPVKSVLQRGGVYVGQNPVMVKNTLQQVDDRIQEMDPKYRKVLGNLAANLATTTLKVKSRYFHRIGVAAKGTLEMFKDLKGFPEHAVFSTGKSFPVLIRHSNSLSADDDARIDARGAGIRIMDSEGNPLLDLTLKTGKAFYARTIGDFATWLVCGVKAREAQVEREPHVRDAVWGSLRRATSYAELHYYSNFCRSFRGLDGVDRFVKFKLRPEDVRIGEDSGKVDPEGRVLPPETGAIPRDDGDDRPPLFLADDFKARVAGDGGVRYILQAQVQVVPTNRMERERVLDCTRPWDPEEHPYVDLGIIILDEALGAQEAEQIEFNPYLRRPDLDVVPARSCTESASIDHGRSLVYEICQRLRNAEPLPESWRGFLEQSGAKVDLSGCPMAGTASYPVAGKPAVARTWVQSVWALLGQPLVQVGVPYALLGLGMWTPLRFLGYVHQARVVPLQLLLPLFLVFSGLLGGLLCVLAKWVLVGRQREEKTIHLWGMEVFLDTIWQAIKTVMGEYFMEITSGSMVFGAWMRLLGAKVEWRDGVYVDSMEALLNPDMVEIERGGCIGRGAMLFGHIYEGEEGRVKFGKIIVGEDGVVGSRAVVMPRVTLEVGSSLPPLALAMKDENIRSK